MNGDGTFSGHILADKLAKLSCSQQSIETLSHWCIFHRRNAKQVVETWKRQFYSSSKDQRVSFLYLANDILQNSRRKGMEFVGEFWKVLPNALNDVIDNGDENGRKAALRLVDIWEDRKVFSPRGQTLREDLLGKNSKSISYKLDQPFGNMLEKLTSSYRSVYNGCDEDTLFGKCWTAISSVEKVEKEFGNNVNLGNISESGVANELWVQHGLLKECIEQLKTAELSRSTLVSHLREALNEQELKFKQLRDQLQVAQARYDQLGRLLLGQAPPLAPPEENVNEIPPPPPASTYCETPPPPNFPPELENREHTTNEENRSGHMINYVFSPFVSERVVGQSDASERQRLDSNGNISFSSVPCFLPQPQHQQPPPPPLFLYSSSMYQPPPPSFPPPPPPPPPPQPPTAYGSSSYPKVGVPPYANPYQLGSDGGYFRQPPYPPPSQ